MRLALPLAALALLCRSRALAEPIMNPVSAERIQEITLPAGLTTIGEPVVTDGKVTVYVDDAKTNWTEALMKGASREHLEVSLKIAAPDGMTKGTRENFGATDEETLEAIDQGVAPGWFAGYGTYKLENGEVDGSAIFAEILFGENTYVRPESASGAGTVVCWENGGGQRQFEYVQWEIVHSDLNLRKVTLPALTIQALSAVSSALPAGVTAEIEPGGVTYTVEDFSAHSSLPVAINAPAGATLAVVYANNGVESVEQRIPVENKKILLNITPDSHTTFSSSKQIRPAQLDYTVAFLSGEEPEEELHDFGLVTVWLLAREKTPYPYYNKQGAKPVANNRLNIWQGKRRVDNRLVYREQYGNAHLSKAGLDFSEKRNGSVRMEVSAPEWAAAYGLSASGGDFIYQNNWALNVSDDRLVISPNKSVTVYDEPLFRTVQAGRALVFLQNGVTARYGGYIYVISWYDRPDADVPRLIEYISVTHDEFSEIVRNAVRENERQLNGPVTEVTGISKNDWQLVVRHDPQWGERAVHYDLHMEDERLVSYSLDGDTVFYVPYPDGYSYADKNVTYQMYHYSDDYQSCAPVELVPTPYGLRFVENHLSPFVLMWDDSAQEGSAPPKTGDDRRPELLLGVMFLSLAALAYLTLRKRSA